MGKDVKGRPGRDGGGRPRILLNVIYQRWRRHEHPNIRRSLDVFFAEMMDMKPDGVRHYEDVADLWLRYRAEINVALDPPFFDTAMAVGRYPPDPEDPETSNRNYIETLIREGDVFVAGGGCSASGATT